MTLRRMMTLGRTRSLARALTALIDCMIVAPALAGCGTANRYGSVPEHHESPTGIGGGPKASPSASVTSGSGAEPAAGGATTPAGGVTVIIQNFTFVPRDLTVDAGTEVTWVNNDTTIHDVRSKVGPAMTAEWTDLFASGTLDQGDTFSYSFGEPGTYYYLCTIHSTMQTMHAQVVVE
jgi:plastocyanin